MEMLHMASAPPIDGPRACTKAELPQVIALVDGEMRQGSGQSLLTDYPLVYRDENLPHVRILKVDGELASVVPFLRWPTVLEGCSLSVGIISPTATAPHHRRKGYGLRCVEDCVRIMERTDCDLSVLWTRETTFPFYRHAGYQSVRSPGWTYLGNRDDAALFADAGERIAIYDPTTLQHLPAIESLHQREPAGLQRSTERSAALLSLPRMETLLALRDGYVSAYLVVSHAVNKPGLIEAGGEESSVVTLLHRAFADLVGNAALTAYTCLSDSVLGRVLGRKMPGRKKPMSASQMMRINNPRAFLERIGPLLAAKSKGGTRSFCLDVERKSVSFEFDGAQVAVGSKVLEPCFRLTRRELVSLVFGAHPSESFDTPVVLRDLFPVYLPIWVLDRS
jgi:GNAT superfamily N-acetyltransferase